MAWIVASVDFFAPPGRSPSTERRWTWGIFGAGAAAAASCVRVPVARGPVPGLALAAWNVLDGCSRSGGRARFLPIARSGGLGQELLTNARRDLAA